MIFKKISKGVKYKKYSKEQPVVNRNIDFKTGLAEDVNELIATVNSLTRQDKLPIRTFRNELNSTVVVNLAIKSYLKNLKGLADEEIIELVKNEAIAEYGF